MEGLASRAAVELGLVLGAPVTHEQQHLSENLHFRATHAELGPLFIKAYRSPEGFAHEGVALDALARCHRWVISPLAGGWLPRTGRSWRAFPAISLRPFVFDREGCKAAATLLADVHRTTAPSPGLPAKAARWALVPERLARVAAWPSVHRQARAVVGRGEELLQDLLHARGYQTHARLLTEDFGPRNIHVREDDGSTVLIDFEHAALGDPHWDLGKVWDDDLQDPRLRHEFVAQYKARSNLDDWPNERALWATRLAAALAIFPYAHRVGDPTFFEQGVRMLEILDAELPDRW